MLLRCTNTLAGPRLRVYFEPEERDDLLQSEVQRFDVGALEANADALRDTLKDKGWWDLGSEKSDAVKGGTA